MTNIDLSKSYIPTVLVVSFAIAVLAGLSAFATYNAKVVAVEAATTVEELAAI